MDSIDDTKPQVKKAKKRKRDSETVEDNDSNKPCDDSDTTTAIQNGTVTSESVASSDKSKRNSSAIEKSQEKEKMRLKKREKRRQKKEAKKKQKLISQGKKPSGGDDGEEKAVDTAKTQSLTYLKIWKKQRADWSFQKVRQVWLLQNMYKADMVVDKYFKVLLRYMEDMKGKARQTTLQKAEELLKEMEDKENLNQEMDLQMNRARDVVQLLAE